MTVNGHVVRFFVCSHKNANLNLVVFVGSQKRCEWISRLHAFRQCRIEVWLNIEVRSVASEVCFLNFGQITRGATGLSVGSWIAHAERYGLVAIVDAHGAL